MPNLIVKGNVETVLNFRDFCELVRREMGDDCADYLQECNFEMSRVNAIRRAFDRSNDAVRSFCSEIEVYMERMERLLNEK